MLLSRKYFLITSILLGLGFPSFSQKQNKFDINVASVYPNNPVLGRENLCFVSFGYYFNEKFQVGINNGFSHNMKSKPANEKIIGAFIGGLLSISNDDTFFIKSSIGVGYYNSKEYKIRDGYATLSYSLNMRPIKWMYMGTQATSLIFFNNNKTEYYGFIIGADF